MRNKKRIW